MGVVRIFVLSCLLLLVFHAQAEPSPPFGEIRTALVIGNADYQVGVLRNPLNDARAVAAKLEQLGFKVLLRENQSREAMHRSINEFSKLLAEGGVGMFYYAGHGMQIKGRNFLIPIDANIQHEDDIEFRGIDASMVLSRMESARSRVNLVVLDACRNNPFARTSRSGLNGLAQMDAPKGTLIAFSTAPGSLAKDGGGANSVYTKHLVQKLSLPALPVEQVFKEVRIEVTKETKDRQIPWESSSLIGDFYFAPLTVADTPTLPSVVAKVESDHVTATTQSAGAAEERQAPNAKSHLPKPANAQNGAAREYHREGYEIENKARNLTLEEIPELEAAAQKGDAIAQTTLGWAYYLGKSWSDGRGIPRSNRKFLKWTQAAARQGYPVAQNNLGALYMEGVGVKKDIRKAQHYFELSWSQGYLPASRNLEEINLLLNGKPDVKQLEDLMKVTNLHLMLSSPAQ